MKGRVARETRAVRHPVRHPVKHPVGRSWEIIPLLTVGFLAPIIGGQVPLQILSVRGGFGAWLRGALGGTELPSSELAILGELVFAGLIYVWLSRRAIQVPSVRFWAPASALLLFGMMTLAYTQFPASGTTTLVYWALLLGSLGLSVALSGRSVGPRLLVWAVLAGCAVAAAKGIAEYGAVRAIEPTYRIFADWNNPNALAAMLAVGVVLAAGLCVASSGSALLIAALSGGIVAFALMLTQSKGGIISAIVGMAILTALALLRGARVKTFVSWIPLAIGALFVIAIWATARETNDAALMSRVSDGSETQSVGFRKNLWRGALEVARDHPGGVGLGAYRFYSAQAGLTTQTFFAHQTYLQILVSGGIAMLLAFLWLIVAWLRDAWQGGRLPDLDDRIISATAAAAVLTVGANGFVESSLFYPGVGIVAFLLFGLVLNQSPCGSQPEPFPTELRSIAAMLFCIPLIGLIYFAWAEYRQSRTVAFAITGQTAEMQASLDQLQTFAPWSPSTWRLAAAYGDPSHGIRNLRRAADREPSVSNLRALGSMLEANDAITAYNKALELDPNNLPTLEALYLEQERLANKHGNRAEEAIRTLQRLVAIEDTPYFLVRAIPEQVPTETYLARISLARFSETPEAKIALLRPAIEGLAAWAEITADRHAETLRIATKQDALAIAATMLETVREDNRIKAAARTASSALAEAYESVGKSEEAAEVRELSEDAFGDA